jgi:RNA polymerase sigma-70 factor, ECF subfamily
MSVNFPATDSGDDAVSAYIAARPRMFTIAYETLRNVDDAEDVVQEAWLRWQRTDREVVSNPTAFLATTASRLALNSAVSARRRHETNADPVSLEKADTEAGPESHVEGRDALAQALLLLLQKLTPLERAAYVLREAFGYPHQQIAELLVISTASARQLLVRGHRSITTRSGRLVAPAAHRRFLHAFLDAAQSGELAGLERLLAAEATAR